MDKKSERFFKQPKIVFLPFYNFYFLGVNVQKQLYKRHFTVEFNKKVLLKIYFKCHPVSNICNNNISFYKHLFFSWIKIFSQCFFMKTDLIFKTDLFFTKVIQTESVHHSFQRWHFFHGWAALAGGLRKFCEEFTNEGIRSVYAPNQNEIHC